MKIASLFLLIAALVGSGLSFATIDAYEFDSRAQEEQFRALVAELRCPKCQNQNIADSNAGLAKDIKDRAHEFVIAGQSNTEITQYMVDRYGDFITYRPPIRPMTWFLWFGPFVLAFLAGGILLLRKIRADKAPSVHIDAEKQQRVDQLMQTLNDAEKRH